MDGLHSEIFVPSVLPSSSFPLSEAGPSLKRLFQLGVSADPAVGRDVPAQPAKL